MAVPSWPAPGDVAATSGAPKLRKRVRIGKYEAREVGLAFAFLAPSLVIFVLFF